jgi:tetratricopeptide (TPR) repeat protein
MTLATSQIQSSTTLARLRERLETIERRIVVMHETPDGAVEVLQLYDEIATLLAAAQEARADVAPEANRADFIRRQLIGKATKIVAQVERSQRAAELAESPIWQTVVAAADAVRRTRIRSLLTSGIVVVGVLLAFFVVLPAVLPATPAPDLAGVVRLAGDQEYAAALERARAEQADFPNDAELTLWIAALEQKLGNPAAAVEWERAQALYGDEEAFYFNRANTLLQLNMVDEAEADGQRLVAMPESEVYGRLILGSVAEQRGDAAAAVVEFQRAADLAEELDDPQLQVMARVRLGMVLQTAPMFTTPTPAQ